MTSELFVLAIDCDPDSTLGTSPQRDCVNVIRYCIERMEMPAHHGVAALTPGGAASLSLPEGTVQVSSEHWKSAYDRLRARASPKDTVLVVLSGHGWQRVSTVKRDSGEVQDELDGKDEFVMVAGRKMILDDYLYKAIVDNELKRPEDERVTLRLIADTCHSGTMYDLPWTVEVETGYKRAARANINPVAERIAYLGGIDAIAMGACKDRESAGCDIGSYGGFGGALTAMLLDTDALSLFITGHAQAAAKKVKKPLTGLGQHVVIQTCDPIGGNKRDKPRMTSMLMAPQLHTKRSSRGHNAGASEKRKGIIEDAKKSVPKATSGVPSRKAAKLASGVTPRRKSRTLQTASNINGHTVQRNVSTSRSRRRVQLVRRRLAQTRLR